MNKTEKLSIIAGSIVTSLICQIWRYKRQKEELEKLRKMNEKIGNFSERLLQSANEPYIRQIKECGDRAVDQYNAHADKVIEDFNKTAEEMRKTDFFLEDIKKAQTEIEQELSKLD